VGRYIVTGFFDTQPLERQLGNLECNATAAVAITHHFLGRMVQKRLRGCIVFTSSVSGYMPSPFSCAWTALYVCQGMIVCAFLYLGDYTPAVEVLVCERPFPGVSSVSGYMPSPFSCAWAFSWIIDSQCGSFWGGAVCLRGGAGRADHPGLA
jgi:NAD(P)-dependent dehydrogenase (short-subunit alcohol dehydrogenase family)